LSLGRTQLLGQSTSYRAAKDTADLFKAAKQLLKQKLRASGYGTWVTKPPEEEMFSLTQKSLVRSCGAGIQLSHTYTADNASKDFM